jgi:hypothetical protein
VDQGERRLSRRDLAKRAAKVGAAGAVAIWVAPHFEDVAYAAGSTGSPPPTTSSSTRKPGHPADYPTCQGDPRVFFELPHTIHVWGSGWAPSSKIQVTLVGVKSLGTITVGANGKFDARFTIPAGLHADQLYRLSFSGYGKNGHPYKCGVAIFIDQRCTGAVLVKKATKGHGDPVSAGDPKAKSGAALASNSSHDSDDPSGSLPFTGADTRSLVLVGAGALIAGKTLYSLRNRVAAAADGDLALR